MLRRNSREASGHVVRACRPRTSQAAALEIVKTCAKKVEILGQNLAALTTLLGTGRHVVKEITDSSCSHKTLVASTTCVKNASKSRKTSCGQKGGLQKNWHALEATLRAKPSLTTGGK